ncbi:MAG: hypothetical protein FWF84_07700, partial [Kiritimatiellaeota bacterium]|nr:hypothetical protein [Kiritimatiellota bacterium]
TLEKIRYDNFVGQVKRLEDAQKNLNDEYERGNGIVKDHDSLVDASLEAEKRATLAKIELERQKALAAAKGEDERADVNLRFDRQKGDVESQFDEKSAYNKRDRLRAEASQEGKLGLQAELDKGAQMRVAQEAMSIVAKLQQKDRLMMETMDELFGKRSPSRAIRTTTLRTARPTPSSPTAPSPGSGATRASPRRSPPTASCPSGAAAIW